MSEFFRTRMGQVFFEGTLPRLVRAVERIADALEVQKEPKHPTDEFLPKLDKGAYVSKEYVLHALAGLEGEAHDYMKKLFEKV